MRFKPVHALVWCIFFVVSCSKDISIPTSNDQDPLSKMEIDDFVFQKLDEQSTFSWDMTDNLMLWSAVVQSDSIVTIGYQPANESNIDQRLHIIDLQSEKWQKARALIMDFILEEMNKELPGQNLTEEDIIAFPRDKFLPAVDVKIHSKNIIEKLRQMPEVRYVEPMGYQTERLNSRSSSGCNNDPDNNIPSADFQTISPNVKVPWNFYNMNIPNAWNTSTGDGITIALLDTGTSPNQNNLGSEFNSGQSQGRFIDREGTYVSSWWWWASPDGPNDRCGHGTKMAGVLAGPRGSDGAAVGVAYNADLLAIRTVADVVILGSRETRGVADGLTMAANRNDVKIISMSIGSIFSSGRISDAVRYAYGRGKLIFAAAGTSTSFTSFVGVVFPAWMNETVAVTGVTDGSPLKKCNSCHTGDKVDFVAVMERRNDDDRTSLTLTMSGNQPSRVGGSSAATATTAGIAALVWATNPSMSRNQVLQKLKNASQFYPSRNSNFGWGLIDAVQAVN